ncbi:MAG TPA: hypothetical protein PK324_22395 [Nocardioides sp.]|nr:hypothetical protein [Nocardioides sp.]
MPALDVFDVVVVVVPACADGADAWAGVLSDVATSAAALATTTASISADLWRARVE